MARKKTHEEYKQDLAEKYPEFECLGKYQGNKVKILHRHKICGYEWMVRPSNILSGYGCPACNGGRCVTGVSDINTVNPEMGRLLKNKSDGDKFSEKSNIPLVFICPECKHEVTVRPADLQKRGFCCRICGDGISIPNKFMEQILIFCKIDYIPEYIFDWAKDKRYDFYIPSLNTTIEVNGIQHYTYSGFKSRTVNDEKNNDYLKEKLAIVNGISNHITLDFRYSTFPYMKDSLKDSFVYNMLNCNISDEEFKSIYINCMKSKMIKSIELWNSKLNVFEIGDKLKLSAPTVTSYLHRGNEIGLCVYRGVKNFHVQVYCLTTNKKFESIKSASEYYHISASGISSCCRQKSNHCGILPSGEKLAWIYYEDYKKTKNIENYIPKISNSTVKVICLNNEMIFDSVKEASSWSKNKSRSNIIGCCKGIRKTSGKHPETNKPLRWMYYNDYLKSTISH